MHRKPAESYAQSPWPQLLSLASNRYTKALILQHFVCRRQYHTTWRVTAAEHCSAETPSQRVSLCSNPAAQLSRNRALFRSAVWTCTTHLEQSSWVNLHVSGWQSAVLMTCTNCTSIPASVSPLSGCHCIRPHSTLVSVRECAAVMRTSQFWPISRADA